MPLNRQLSLRNYRIVVMGAAGVGKSSIISQFIQNVFPESHKATVEELHRHVMKFYSTEAEVDILDTSGSYEFPAMRRLAISSGDAFILVYSPDVENSFDTIASIRGEIVEVKTTGKFCIVVVKNKVDLPENKQQIIDCESQRHSVTYDWSGMFISTSAKKGTGIDAVFHVLEDRIKEKVKEDERHLALLRRTSAPVLTVATNSSGKPKTKSRHMSVN